MALHTRSKKPRNRSDGTKPLPEPMLTFQQGGLVTFISAHFTKKPTQLIPNMYSEITLWKLLPHPQRLSISQYDTTRPHGSYWFLANGMCLSDGLIVCIHECRLLERGSGWIHTWMSCAWARVWLDTYMNVRCWVTLWLDACMNTKWLSDGLIRCIHECQVLKRRPDWMHTGMSSAWATGWLDAYRNVRCLSDGLIVFIHECQVLERRAYWMHTWMSGAFKTVILDAYMNVSSLSAGLIGCIHKWSFLWQIGISLFHYDVIA